MKKLVIGSLIIMMLLVAQNTWAQRSISDRIDHLKTELKLSDNQTAQIEKIFEAKDEEMKALRSDENKTRDERHAAMQNFRQTIDQEIESILDEDQQAKFQEIKKEHRGDKGRREAHNGHHKHFQDGKGKAVHSEIKAYKDQNIRPVMLEQRAKLEPKISKADKKLIAQMRVDYEKMKAEREAHFKEMKNKREAGEKPDFKNKHKEGKKWGDEEKHEKMKSLVERYKNDIEPLFAEISDQQEKWKNDIHEIMHKTQELKGDEMKKDRKNMMEKHGDRRDMMKMGHFLLLDPNEKIDATNNQSLVTKVTAFPNPATTTTTIEYEVLEAGDVLIELRDNKGNLLKTVKNTFEEKGTHRVTISLETYKSDVYFVVIKDKNGVSTTKNIVSVK